MSIRAMTWAFALPLEPRAKIALLAIADNARDDGVAWPSRDTIAEKSSQSRATINRKLKFLTELDVLTLAERFREDGSQTTDEIRLNLALTGEELMQRMQGLSASERGDDGEDDRGGDDHADATNREEGGYQSDTPPVHSGHPGDAVVTPRGLHSCNPQDEPSLEPKIPPNPPLGGVRAEDGPLKKPDKAATETRERLWQAMLGVYPGIASMDQQAGRAAFDKLSVDECEWAVSVAQPYASACDKLRKPPKGVHLWLRKAMFKNYPRGRIEPPERRDAVWIAEGSLEDRALRYCRQLTRQPQRFIQTRRDGARGYERKDAVGVDLLAMLEFADQATTSWPRVQRGSDHYAAWQRRFVEWIGAALPMDLGDGEFIRVPTLWPPKKDGTIYRDDPVEPEPASPEEPDHA